LLWLGCVGTDLGSIVGWYGGCSFSVMCDALSVSTRLISTIASMS